MSNLRATVLITALSLLSAGCYERVVSERPFAGMSSTRSDLPTAHDYSQAQAEFIKRHEDRNKKPFDPIGDWIIKPIGGAASSIGNAFSGGDDDDHTSGQPTVKPPARPATSAGDAPTQPPAPATPAP